MQCPKVLSWTHINKAQLRNFDRVHLRVLSRGSNAIYGQKDGGEGDVNLLQRSGSLRLRKRDWSPRKQSPKKFVLKLSPVLPALSARRSVRVNVRRVVRDVTKISSVNNKRERKMTRHESLCKYECKLQSHVNLNPLNFGRISARGR